MCLEVGAQEATAECRCYCRAAQRQGFAPFAAGARVTPATLDRACATLAMAAAASPLLQPSTSPPAGRYSQRAQPNAQEQEDEHEDGHHDERAEEEQKEEEEEEEEEEAAAAAQPQPQEAFTEENTRIIVVTRAPFVLDGLMIAQCSAHA